MDTNIIDKIKSEEKRTKKRMFYYSSVPVVITIALFFTSYLTVNNANETVEELNTQITDLNQRITEMNQKINELNNELNIKNDSLKKLEEQYAFAINYKDKRFRFGYSADKFLFSRYPKQTRVLQKVRQMLDRDEVKWKLGGQTVEEGFDSPSFAAYLVNRYSETNIPKQETYRLYNYLPKKETPEIGDLVFYEHGYTMFYFEHDHVPFCVGMTPVGLASLKLDFGPRIIGYGKVDY